MTPSTIAQSSALRVIGPIWSSDSASGKTPARLTLPQLGFRPVRPFMVRGKADRAAGVGAERGEAKSRRGRRARTRGRRAGPIRRVPWIERRRNAGMVRAERTLGHLQLAQDHRALALSRATTVASWVGTLARWIAIRRPSRTPAVLQRSFTAIGTPCSGPRDLPAAVSASPRRVGERPLARHGRIALQPGIEPVDAVEDRLVASTDETLRAFRRRATSSSDK